LSDGIFERTLICTIHGKWRR